MLRDITRQLADVFQKLVMVVDPSEEIAGGGDLPHSCIGSARRMLGTVHQSKYEVLEEAVANHGPEVIMPINTETNMNVMGMVVVVVMMDAATMVSTAITGATMIAVTTLVMTVILVTVVAVAIVVIIHILLAVFPATAHKDSNTWVSIYVRSNIYSSSDSTAKVILTTHTHRFISMPSLLAEQLYKTCACA